MSTSRIISFARLCRLVSIAVAVAWLLNDDERFMEERIIPRINVSFEKKYEYPETEQLMKYIYYVNRDALMEDLFQKICKE